MPSSIEGKEYVHAVTAKHVVEAIKARSADGAVLLRLNTRDGGTAMVSSQVVDWKFHPSEPTADVAAIQWGPDQAKYDYRTIPASILITDETIAKHSIGPGDEVFFPGLFVNHYGKKRNLPIIRIGNIAAMTEEPVSTSTCGDIEAYLVEARSIGGLSGSPVLVHLVLGRRHTIEMTGGPNFFLLGLMHGHYDSPLTDADAEQEDQEHAGRVNMGIAIVVPAHKVRELIDQRSFVDARTENDERLRKELASKAD